MKVEYIPIEKLKFSEYNPRALTEKEFIDLKESLLRFGFVEPIVINSAPERMNVIIGGHQRVKVAEKMGIKEIPVVYVNIPDLKKEQELNLRLNKNLGHWDYDLLANFDENLLLDVGFEKEELDEIFELDLPEGEEWDLEKEIKRAELNPTVQKGDLYQLGEHRLLCGDATNEEDMEKLMAGEKITLCFTDPPYNLAYLHPQAGYGTQTKKSKGGFGWKKKHRYLETDEAPEYDDWMKLVNEIAGPNFNIIIFENWKNVVSLWQVMSKYWRIRNMLVWHTPNRHQGYTRDFYNKYDIALLGENGKTSLNLEEEEEKLENEYSIALYATMGRYYFDRKAIKGKYHTADFISHPVESFSSTKQDIIYGTKPVNILIPYIKILSRRGDNILDSFGGAGATLIAAEKLKRRCFMMEIVPLYCDVIIRRFERLTGQKAVKLAN